jgi:hypothetical protein
MRQDTREGQMRLSLEVLPTRRNSSAYDAAQFGGAPQDISSTTPKIDDYELAIDSQVEKFVEIKQRLTYFLITASSVVIAFMMNFFVDNLPTGRNVVGTRAELVLILASALAGLLTAGSSLLALHLDHRSYSLHLNLRYGRKSWDSLPQEEQRSWDRISRWAQLFFRSALALLFLQIALAVAFFVKFLPRYL